MWPDISLDKINDNGGGGLDGVTVSLACPPAIQPGTPRSSVIREPLGHLASADYKGIEQANGSPSDLNKIIDTRHTKRGRNYRDSYTSGTPRGNSFQEGITICLAPMNPAKICDLHLIRIFKFLNSAAPGTVKEVLINEFRKLVSVDAQTPRLKGLLLQVTMLYSTAARTILPRPENSSVGLIRAVDLDLSYEIMNLITHAAQVQHAS